MKSFTDYKTRILNIFQQSISLHIRFLFYFDYKKHLEINIKVNEIETFITEFFFIQTANITVALKSMK